MIENRPESLSSLRCGEARPGQRSEGLHRRRRDRNRRRLRFNTHGGQLGEAYTHGMSGIAEGVRQLRGTSVNRAPMSSTFSVAAGTGVPASGLIHA
jgi:hypothetical protein